MNSNCYFRWQKCLFVRLFYVPLERVFISYGDVDIAGEILQNVGLYPPPTVFEQIFIVPCLLTGPRFLRYHPKDCPHLFTVSDKSGGPENLF